MAYGVTEEQYDAMVETSGGRCYSCWEVPEEDHLGRSLVFDHDHKTGKPRGLLCVKCNLALGYVDDSIEKLEKLITYLKTKITI